MQVYLTNNATWLPILISIIASTISAIALIITIIQNVKLQKQYIESKEPALSLNLRNSGPYFYLSAVNTGGSKAENVVLDPKDLGMDTEEDFQLIPDKLFNNPFDLYPNEKVTGYLGYFNNQHLINEKNQQVPKLTIQVQYNKFGKKKVEYSRIVALDIGSEKLIKGDIRLSQEITENLEKLMKAHLRIANYMDGFQLAPFDDINLLSDRSLHDDLNDVVNVHSDKKNVLTRKDILDNKRADNE